MPVDKKELAALKSSMRQINLGGMEEALSLSIRRSTQKAATCAAPKKPAKHPSQDGPAQVQALVAVAPEGVHTPETAEGKYTGPRDLQGRPHGVGKMVFENGSLRWMGLAVNDGDGIENGLYEGNFVDGKVLRSGYLEAGPQPASDNHSLPALSPSFPLHAKTLFHAYM